MHIVRNISNIKINRLDKMMQLIESKEKNG